MQKYKNDSVHIKFMELSITWYPAPLPYNLQNLQGQILGFHYLILTLIDHEIALKILEFVFNSIEKVKPGFLLSSMCVFSETNRTKS